MPFIPHTPEALMGRMDSKNPATTCKGITSSGRPCRRAIQGTKEPENGVLAVVSVTDDDGAVEAAAFYCWQHKDQAEQLAAANNAALPGGGHVEQTKLYSLKERSSIDTLIQRLGFLEVDDEPPSKESRRRKKHGSSGRRRHSGSSAPPRRIHRPPTWERVEGPLMSVPEGALTGAGPYVSEKPHKRRPSSTPPKKAGFFASLCCMRNAAADDEHVEAVKPRRRTGDTPPQRVSDQQQPQQEQQQQQPQQQASPEAPVATGQEPAPERRRRNSHQKKSREHHHHHRRPVVYNDGAEVAPDAAIQAPRRTSASGPSRKALAPKSNRPINKKSSSDHSQTASLLSLIPKSLSPQTTSVLLAELSKPISEKDEEGYIYIFWLTDSAAGSSPDTTAASLLTPPSGPPVSARRTSEVLRTYSVKKHGTAEDENNPSVAANKPPTILLKIGRANNVQRRMNEWTRQCGYALSLVRFYPYVSSLSPSPGTKSGTNSRRSSAQRIPSSSSASLAARPDAPGRGASDSSNASGVRKVPHVHRVERLIHLELANKRVIRKCEACGKEHREWFEVEASRDGVKAVDETVRRWVAWAEGLNV